MAVSLRLEVKQKDAKKIITWLEDKNITQYLNEDINSIESIQQVINRNQSDLLTFYLNQDGRFFLIDLDQECIGFINLFTIRKNKEYEVVIAIGEEDKWGKQYAKHALEQILREVFFEWRIERIQAKICTENARSIGLFTHLNFQEKQENDKLLIYSLDFDSYLDYLHGF